MNNASFLEMTIHEREALILHLHQKREVLKKNSQKKRAASGRKKKEKKISFSDPTLQALFDANREAVRKALRM